MATIIKTQVEFEEKLKVTSCDCANMIFECEIILTQALKTVQKDVREMIYFNFENAIFEKKVDFSNTIFKTEVSFINTKFQSESIFTPRTS